MFLLRVCGLAGLISIALAPLAAGQAPVSVRAEVAHGPYFVGQAFELRVGVIAASQRPKIDPPRIAGARVWAIGTAVRPITTTGIGSMVAQQNLFVVRFRVLPNRAGTLEIPAIQVQLKNRSGRSQPKALSIQTVPIQGRPAEFLGGVGRFELQAEASPKVVRVGQELDFRIKVTGPAAWGMTDRPDLGRFGRLPLGLRIEPKPDETTDEPPVRTLVYRLRPTQAGEAVLPPVAIAAFDPALAHYVTQVTAGVPIRVVAVPAFDPTTIHYDSPSTTMSRPAQITSALAALMALTCAVFIILRRLRRRPRRPLPFSPELARRFARQTARRLALVRVETSGTWNSQGARPTDVVSAARQIGELLTGYLRLGTGHSVSVLTPEESREGVAQLTSSDELALQAAELTARCDSILYAEPDREPDGELSELLDDARRLFEALGRVNRVRGPGR